MQHIKTLTAVICWKILPRFRCDASASPSARKAQHQSPFVELRHTPTLTGEEPLFFFVSLELRLNSCSHCGRVASKTEDVVYFSTEESV